jgi:hypothetical protein
MQGVSFQCIRIRKQNKPIVTTIVPSQFWTSDSTKHNAFCIMCSRLEIWAALRSFLTEQRAPTIDLSILVQKDQHKSNSKGQREKQAYLHEEEKPSRHGGRLTPWGWHEAGRGPRRGGASRQVPIARGRGQWRKHCNRGVDSGCGCFGFCLVLSCSFADKPSSSPNFNYGPCYMLRCPRCWSWLSLSQIIIVGIIILFLN